MSKLLHIDTDLQQLNRIHKDGSNLVSQITDKANNIAFVPINSANKGTYTYDKGFYLQNNGYRSVKQLDQNHNLSNNDFVIVIDWRFPVNFSSTFHNAIILTNPTVTSYSWGIQKQSSGSARFFYSTDGTSITAVNFNIGAELPNIITVIGRKGNNIYVYNNGVLEFTQAMTDTIYFDASFNYELATVLSGSITDMYINFIKVFNNFTLNELGNSTLSGSIIEGFTHYKRYANKNGNIKAFLSSRYLKDAVINSSDEISFISDEIGVIYDGVGLPKIKPNVLLFGENSAQTKYLRSSISQNIFANIFANDFYIGTWCKLDGHNTVDAIMGVNQGGFQTFELNYYTVTGNLSFWLSDDGGVSNVKLVQYNFTPILGNYYYIAIVRSNDVLYLLVDGILRAQLTLPTNYTPASGLNPNLFMGYANRIGSLWGSMDDILIVSGDSIINPTGYSVGQKVFEPPRRRSLEVMPATYNGGKYTFAEIDKMIRVDGYVPVATAAELDALRTTTDQQMGDGTAWKGTYTTGVDKKYIQVADIDLMSYGDWSGLGTSTTKFTGVYDGNRGAIDNLTASGGIVPTNTLIGYGDGATLRNIILTNIATDGGGIVGADTNPALLVENCSVSGTITSNGNFIAGIVSGNNYGTIRKCSWSGTMNDLTATDGLAGISASNYGTVEECSASGTIQGDDFVGGIIGYHRAGATCSNCYSTCTVTATNGYAGGLIGVSIGGAITNSYAASVVTAGNTNVGGLTGTQTGTTTNSYWNTDLQATSFGGTGKTTVEMQQGQINDATIYVGWSLTKWGAGTNSEYPSLIQGLQFIRG